MTLRSRTEKMLEKRLENAKSRKGPTSTRINIFGIFQAILFYTPRWLWKNWETGKIGALVMDLDQGIIT